MPTEITTLDALVAELRTVLAGLEDEADEDNLTAGRRYDGDHFSGRACGIDRSVSLVEDILARVQAHDGGPDGQ